MIYDCFECVNNGYYYGMADYFESFSDETVAYITENHCGFADGAYYEVNNIHEVDVEYANGTLLNLVRYGCVKFNEPMPDYLKDDSLVKAFFVCVKKDILTSPLEIIMLMWTILVF